MPANTRAIRPYGKDRGRQFHGRVDTGRIRRKRRAVTAPYSPDVQLYLKRLEIDERTIEHARAAWSIIGPRLPRLIDRYYDHLFATGCGDYFANADVSKIKVAQYAYWQSLFAGEFDAAYRAHTGRIGDRHRAFGVDLTLYIGAYAWFSQHLFRLIARASPPQPIKTHDIFVATNKLIYLDLILATKGADAVILD